MPGIKYQVSSAKCHVSRKTYYALRFTFYALILLVFISGCNNDPHPLRFGVHTLRPDDTLLRQVQSTGADTIVQVFAWREIEPTRDQFHWEVTDQLVAGAEYYGLDVVARLDQHPAWVSQVGLSLNAPPDDLEDYRTFVQRVAARYKGRIRAYIIWNEPNLAIEWGGQRPDPAVFTKLLRVGYEAVKASDPAALVVAAGLAPTNSHDTVAIDDRLFLQGMYDAGASAYFDVLAAHPYSFGQPPRSPEKDSQHPAFRRLAELRQIMVANGDGYKPVWITEMGWTIAPPPEQPDIGVSLSQQADYLAASINIIRQEWPWVELITVWNMSIPTPGDPFGGYSLLDQTGQPRPALAVWQQAVGNRAERGLPLPQVRPQNVVSILGRDVPIHLGDTELSVPWWPLYGGRNPSLDWRGGFYLTDPGHTDWTLLLEMLQNNELGTVVAVNGVPLTPDLPQQDYTRRWLTMHRTVPVSLLRPGYNELTITMVSLLPDTQHRNFVWDDFQVRNIRLVRPAAALNQ